MGDVTYDQTRDMETVVAHPRLAAGTRRILSHKIARKRAKAIAPLRHATECLKRLAHQSASSLAEEYARECELVLVELEALDPSVPPSVEQIGAISTRLAQLREEIYRGNLNVVRPAHPPLPGDSI